jgi:peptidoglycan/xylan/chitin deacetylase (PgdA/CDA1 family)
MKLAELLAKYGLKGTFYVPLYCDRGVMSAAQLCVLSQSFEIGGHTVTHCDLNVQGNSTAAREIVECKRALEDITSRPCQSFCFPMGRFSRRHLKQVREAGFSLARTVELMSLDAPRFHDGLAVLPTTVQAAPVQSSAYVKNSLKRLRLDNLLCFQRHRKSSWVAMLESVLEQSLQRGGVLHLWGHSWEIDAYSDWKSVEGAFSMLAQLALRATFVSNGQLLDHAANLEPAKRSLRNGAPLNQR